MISNLCKDNSRLDLGIQVINNLRKRFNNIQKFPWIVSDISEDLNELNEIANMNYVLRDSFQEVENNIRSTLSNFYNSLREYDYKIVKKSREILSKIESTMDESIINSLDTYDNILDQFEGKKMFNVLSQIFDNIKKFGWNIKQENGEIRIVKINSTKEDEDIGKIKVFCKKVALFIEKLNISFEFKDINDSNFNSKFAVLKNTADIII